MRVNDGSRIAAGAVLGTGLGALIGTIAGQVGTGIWIGAVIGVGLAFAWNALSTGRKK
jgi:hypothetical protein